MGLLDKIKGIGRGYVTALLLKKAANGDFGPQAKWIYWHLRDIKTDTGIILAAVAGIIAVLQSTGACDLASSYVTWVHCDVWADTVKHVTVSLSGVFLYLGQVDGGLQMDAPVVPPKTSQASAAVVD